MQAMEYRTSFLLGILANTLDFFFGLVQYLLFFSVAHSIAGWELPQMLTLYAVFMTVFSLHFIFLYPNLEDMSMLVNTGRLDLILCRPVSSQIILSFRRVSFDEFGSLLAAQILLLGLLLTGQVPFSLWHFLLFLVMVGVALALIYSLFLFFLALTVSWEKMENLSELLWSVFGFCRYPIQIYPRWLRALFWSFLPIAFVATVPAGFLARGPDYGLLVSGVSLAVSFLLLSRMFWRKILAEYTSSGG